MRAGDAASKDVALLRMVYNTTSSLFQVCLFTVILTTKRLAEQLSQALVSAANLEFNIDNSQLFYVNSDHGFFVGQDGQKVPGSSNQFFVSTNGKCVFPNRVNDGLEDSKGNPINIDDLKGQLFFAVEIGLDIPDELRLVVKQAFSENITKLMRHHTIWSDAEKRSQTPQDQPGAEPVFKPTS